MPSNRAGALGNQAPVSTIPVPSRTSKRPAHLNEAVISTLDVGYNFGYTSDMKTAISIPNDVFEAAEQTARRLSMSRSEFYTRAVEAYLEAHKTEGVTEKLNEVYATEPSRLDPVLAEMQAASMAKIEW